MTLTPEQMLDKYYEAEASLLEGKTIQWDGKTLTKENLDVIQRGRREWERKVLNATRSRMSLARFV